MASLVENLEMERFLFWQVDSPAAFAPESGDELNWLVWFESLRLRPEYLLDNQHDQVETAAMEQGAECGM